MIKTAIITGISGQDGAYLSQFLLSKEYYVIGVTRSYENSNISKLKYLGIDAKIKLEECDLTDIPSILNLIKKYKPNEIYNLAAQSSVGLSFEQPIGTITFNAISVLNVLECIRILDLDIRFYQASSSEMYGKVNNLPITENTPLHPLSPYAISKATAYWSVVNYRESYGLYASNGVLFNHESYLRSGNFFVKKIINGAIRIYKKEIETLPVGNLDLKRDFGYAPEYVKSMWLMLQQPKSDDYLICSGRSVSLSKIVYYVFNKFGISHDRITIDETLFRPTDIVDIHGDNTKAREKLNWNYNYSFFEILDLLVEEELKNWKAKR